MSESDRSLTDPKNQRLVTGRTDQGVVSYRKCVSLEGIA